MAHIDFISQVHGRTKRNYIERVLDQNKPECIERAKNYDYDYWDGDRKTGYGGYKYDGRWRPVAEALIKHYGLKAGMKVLDVGCGKGFLMYDLLEALPGLECQGIDISQYAIDRVKEEVRPYVRQGLAQELPYPDKSFDLVLSINTLHNLFIYDFKKAIQEVNRVQKKDAYIVVESYRNESEKMNLFYWVLTCECFFATREWEWLFQEYGYKGDYSFIFFE